jgi:Family of unknown function (DUF6049)
VNETRRARLLAVAGAGVLFFVTSSTGLAAAAAAPGDVVAGAAGTSAVAVGSGVGAGSGVAAGSGLVATSAPVAPITMALISTAPIAPPVQPADTMVTVRVSIANNTDNTLQQIQLRAVRDSPIIRQGALDDMLAHPIAPVDPSLTQPMPTLKYADSIPAHSTTELTYQFPASSIRESGGVCLCQSGVYPIDISAYAATTTRATPSSVAWVQTYLISVASTPVAEQVSWLWPLIDRPHRVSDTAVFTDDALATEIATGGRLDRALQVLEQVGPTSKVTVVIDPELLAELQQMVDGYQIQSGATTVAGTDGAAAADWLRRLRAVIATTPIALTSYGDPAINASVAAGLVWNAPMPATMAVQVDQALGRVVTPADSTLAWPPDETLTPAALTELADANTGTVVLNDATVPAAKGAPVGTALTSVTVANAATTTVAALVTSSSLEQRVDGLLNSGGSSQAGLPALLAELSLRTLQSDAAPSFVVLTPSRYVDTNPATAAAVITATATSVWASPVAAAGVASAASATSATGATSAASTDHDSIVGPNAQHYGGSAPLIAQAVRTKAFVTDFESALDGADTTTLLGAYPAAIQLAQSAGWSTDPAAATAFGAALAGQQRQLTSQVQIVRPSNGSYSLASESAPLLVTVANSLPVPVTVRLAITTVGGLAGFRADDGGAQVIPADSRRTIKVQAHVTRSGHFRVQAQLLMPAGGTFGAALPLSIYSSALGTIGVVITVVAGTVLLLALIYRFARRWRHHRDLIHRMMAEEQLVPAGARG